MIFEILQFVPYHLFSFVVVGCFGSFLASVGIIGNIIAIFLFLRRRLWARLNYYLICLAIWDLGLLASASMMYTLTPLLHLGDIPFVGPWTLVYPYGYFLSNVTMIGCVWTTVTVTVERYLAVCHPLRHKRVNSSRRAKMILGAVSFAAILFSIPRAFEIVRYECPDPDPDSNSTTSIIMKSWLLQDFTYFLIYRIICGAIFTSAGPFLVLTILTALMCVAVRRAALVRRRISKIPSIGRDRGESGPMDQKYLRKTDSSVNRMLIVVLMKFLASYTLPCLIDVFEKALPPDYCSISKISIPVLIFKVFLD